MGDAKILKTEDWGKKRLAYQIEKQDEGYYVVLNVQANNALLPDFEKRLVNEESLLRHLVLKKN
jgi:small subunit ribosomal protein S6